MLSGIGQASLLARFEIPIVCDLPGVGKNLQDHVTIPSYYLAREEIQRDHGSPLTEARALLGIGSNGREDTRPNVIVWFAPAAAPLAESAGPPPNGYSLVTSLMRIESRGELELTSPDPHAPVKLRVGMLAHENEVRLLGEGLRWAVALGRSQAFASLREREIAPGAEFDTEADLAQYLRQHALPFAHLAGTCRMGIDAEAVVGPDLTVHGVRGLRVIDASVMPTIVACPTLPATLIIAELGASFLASASDHG
jgi:choline dehydrogenase